MKSSLLLEDFAKPEPVTPPPASFSEAELEARGQQAYEQGYQAGWEDALKSAAHEQERIGADFARNLQDMGFTFHEARQHVMKSLEPLLREVLHRILPQIAVDTLGQHIHEELMRIAEASCDSPVKIVISPQSLPAIRPFIDDSLTIPLEITEEPSLAEGQVYLRIGDTEKKIDVSAVIKRISQLVDTVYILNEEGQCDGGRGY